MFMWQTIQQQDSCLSVEFERQISYTWNPGFNAAKAAVGSHSPS